MPICRTLLLCSLSLVFTACSSMNKDECLSADWHLIGFEDGSRGIPQSQIREYRQDCAEFGIGPNLDQYQLGHRSGSEQYCTARNGFTLGQQNNRYPGGCPEELEEVFLSGYEDGQTIWNAQKHLQKTESLIEQQQERLEQLPDLIAKKEEQLVADGQTREQRIALREEIKTLEQEQTLLQHSLPQLFKDSDRQQRYIQALQNQLALKY